jgi:hypothetical protein
MDRSSVVDLVSNILIHRLCVFTAKLAIAFRVNTMRYCRHIVCASFDSSAIRNGTTTYHG